MIESFCVSTRKPRFCSSFSSNMVVFFLSYQRALEQFPSDNFPPTFPMHLCCQRLKLNQNKINKTKSILTWTRMFSSSRRSARWSSYTPPKNIVQDGRGIPPVERLGNHVKQHFDCLFQSLPSYLTCSVMALDHFWKPECLFCLIKIILQEDVNSITGKASTMAKQFRNSRAEPRPFIPLRNIDDGSPRGKPRTIIQMKHVAGFKKQSIFIIHQSSNSLASFEKSRIKWRPTSPLSRQVTDNQKNRRLSTCNWIDFVLLFQPTTSQKLSIIYVELLTISQFN